VRWTHRCTSRRWRNKHREIVLAALEAGRHVHCEKLLANTLPEAEAREMLDAARNAGTVNMVCVNYRRAPAVQLA
jgi:predicted dehydrogenase